MGRKTEKQKEEYMNIADFARLEDELHEAKAAAGQAAPLKLWQRVGDRYFDWQEHRQRHSVNRKTYLWLSILLGWAGIHRFYEKRWKLGLFYLFFFWSGFPAALALVDFCIALPMKADESGSIMI